MKPKTIVLIDLDNCTDKNGKTLIAATSLYTKDTLFVPIGLKRHITSSNPNGLKWDKLDDWFRFLQSQLEKHPINHVCPDASDMAMFDYVGKNLPYWIVNDVKNVIIVSRDIDLFNLGFILKPHFNTWVMSHISDKERISVRNKGARKVGAGNIPMIYVK